MNKPIQATLTLCRHHQPLVVLDSEPFNGMELRPDDLLRLAQRFADLAEIANDMHAKGRLFRPVKVQMSGLTSSISE